MNSRDHGAGKGEALEFSPPYTHTHTACPPGSGQPGSRPCVHLPGLSASRPCVHLPDARPDHLRFHRGCLHHAGARILLLSPGLAPRSLPRRGCPSTQEPGLGRGSQGRLPPSRCPLQATVLLSRPAGRSPYSGCLNIGSSQCPSLGQKRPAEAGQATSRLEEEQLLGRGTQPP